MPLHTGYVEHLVSVANKRVRRRLQRRAVRQGWSPAELAAAVRAALGPRGPSRPGRLKRPATAEGGLLQLGVESRLWVNRCEVAVDVVEQEATEGRPSAEVGQRIQEIAECLKAVERAARVARRRIRNAT